MEFLGYGDQYLSARAVKLGKFPNPVTNFPRLKQMTVNEEDVFLCAYPKAGENNIRAYQRFSYGDNL